jgi:hypothetical protein
MRFLVRTVVVLLVLGVLVGVLLVVGEMLARQQVEAAVTDAVERELREITTGDEDFASVETTLGGWALVGIATGRFEQVQVDARDGVIEEVPVDDVRVVATGVSSDGRSAESLQVTLRAEAGPAIAAELEPEQAVSVESVVALPPDRVRLTSPFELPLVGRVPVDVEVLFREADGGIVVEPVAAQAAGIEVDLTRVDLLPSHGIAADELPAGLRVEGVEVVDESGTAVVVSELSCTAGCTLRR